MDLKRDLFQIRYDPKQVTPGQMLTAIQELGFRGEVVSGLPPLKPPPRFQHRDLTRLPTPFQQAANEARRDGRPLLIAFHAPG